MRFMLLCFFVVMLTLGAFTELTVASLIQYSAFLSGGVGLLCGALAVVIEYRYGLGGAALQRQIENVYQQGKDAFEQGVTLKANPYQGIDSELWVEGWLDAKEETRLCK